MHTEISKKLLEWAILVRTMFSKIGSSFVESRARSGNNEIGGEADAFTNRMRPFLGFVSIEVEQEQNKEKS